MWNTFCSFYFYVMIEFFGRLWVQNVFHISCTIALFFKYYALFLFFFRSYLAGMAKNNQTEKQIDVDIQATLKHRPAWKLTEECKVCRYKIDCSYHNYLHPNIRSSHLEVFCKKGVLKSFAKFTWKHTYARVSLSVGLSSVISKVSVADFEHE